MKEDSRILKDYRYYLRMERRLSPNTVAAYGRDVAELLAAVDLVQRASGIFDRVIMLLIALTYSVCDLICILFFCPFQSWFLRNKCCSTCRIYNWDYAMMFTPLFFVRRLYTWSLLFLSVALLARWEITFYKYPERFSEATNGYLSCSRCTEKLCAHKNQLRSLWKEIALYTEKRIRKLRLDVQAEGERLTQRRKK